MELRQRMDPDHFAATTSAMDQIASEMENYISYARILTGKKSTSRFSLVEASLKKFYEEVLLKDYKKFDRYEFDF